MSMITYGVSDYGLYVTDSDLENYAKRNNMDEWDIAEDAGMNNYGDADGEAVSLFTDNQFNVDESFYIASVDRYPTLFDSAYKSKEEALEELKERFGKYLSEDFDYEGRFVHYVGTMYLLIEV